MNNQDIENQVANNPLTKEQAREQFIRKTEELGLKHSFTFDEAWEIGEELRKKQEFRNKMEVIADNFKNSENFITGEEANKLNPLKHSFADGCYIREVF